MAGFSSLPGSRAEHALWFHCTLECSKAETSTRSWIKEDGQGGQYQPGSMGTAAPTGLLPLRRTLAACINKHLRSSVDAAALPSFCYCGPRHRRQQTAQQQLSPLSKATVNTDAADSLQISPLRFSKFSCLEIPAV